MIILWIVLGYIVALLAVGILASFMARASRPIMITDVPAPNGEGHYGYVSHV